MNTYQIRGDSPSCSQERDYTKAAQASRIPGFIGRSLVVGIGFAAVSLSISGILAMIGMPHPGANKGAVQLPVLVAQGSLIGLILGLLALSTRASSWRHISIWGSILFFNSLSVAIEGMFFAPALATATLPWMTVQKLVVAAATGVLVTQLFPPSAEPARLRVLPLQRSWFGWTWRLLLSAFSYLASYFVFGAVNYALVTRPYYEAHAGGLVVPSPTTILAAESVRALLIVLSVLPLLLTTQWPKLQRLLAVGLVLFTIGGIVPLLEEVNTLPLFLLVASGWEIFFQNVSAGIVTALLLGNDGPNALAPLTQPLPDAA